MGQLGTRDIVPFTVPTAVVNIAEDLVSIVAGANHTCALTVGGEVYCWGGNSNGELGRGATGSYAPVPEKVPGARFTSLVARGPNTCGIGLQGKIFCWGINSSSQISADGSQTPSEYPAPHQMPVPGIVTRVTVGEDFICALQSGQPMCWGTNLSGQLGTGAAPSSNNPIANVPGLANVYELGTGWNHTLAYGLGLATSWGDNGAYQLGDGGNQSRTTPGPFNIP